MDKYMRQIPSVRIGPFDDDADALWEYANLAGDRLRATRSQIVMSEKSETVSISIQEIENIALEDNWKDCQENRNVIIATPSNRWKFLVDTVRGNFVDAVTVFRQLQRTVKSNQ